MKLIVNRQLTGGVYIVAFTVSDFSAEEIRKMETFGVPVISMMLKGPTDRVNFQMPLNRIAPQHKAVFSAQEEAKTYETRVVTQIRHAIESLRERADDFTSSSEVDI
jgi:hypothetical protein